MISNPVWLLRDCFRCLLWRLSESFRSLRGLADGVAPAVASNEIDTAPANLRRRVHLRPDIGERQLFGRFHLDESRDSEHNLGLLPDIPMLYRRL